MQGNTRKLTLLELIQIHGSMARDFHKGEIKPLWRILYLWLQGRYMGYGYFEEGARVGYMLFYKPGRQAVNTLLDYYAIEPSFRSKGYGSAFFQAVCAQVPGLVLEVEDPAFSLDEQDRVKRERRIAFYQRNGCRMTQLKASILEEHYCIMTGPGTVGARLLPSMDRLYRGIFGRAFAQKHIRLKEGA